MVSEGVREFDKKKDILSKLIGGYAGDLANVSGA
jgi:hypothetical protein